MNEANRSQTVTLTTLSPLFIGAGDEAQWSPSTDLIQTGSHLILIDSGKLQNALQKHPEKVDTFVSGIRQGFDNNRSAFSLERFIRTDLHLDPQDLASRTLTIEGAVGRNHVRRFIATAGRPFVPGSSIKGALRTAVVLDWLQHNPQGKAFLSQITSLVENRNRYELERLNPDEACFGTIASDPLRYLLVSDTGCIDKNVLSVSEVKRVSIKPPQNSRNGQRSDIPQWSETIPPITTLSCTISIRKPIHNTGFPFIDSQSLPQLLSIVNRQSLDIINREIAQLEDNSTPRAFAGFLQFYERLEQQHLGEHEALARIGSGKTWFDNSIGLALDNEVFDPKENLFGAFLKMLRLGGDPFPSTRSAVVKNGQPSLPLGWVKLTMK